AQNSECIIQTGSRTFSGIALFPEFIVQPPADFNGILETGVKAYFQQSDKADERAVFLAFDCPDSKASFLGMPLEALDQPIRLGWRQHVWKILHHLRVRIHAGKHSPIVSLPSSKTEPF